MTAVEFYQTVFNPAALVVANKDGLFDLREAAVANSHVLVTDKIIAAYHYDENFEHKKLINPDKTKGMRQRHDYILLNNEGDIIDIYLVEMKSSKDTFSHLRNQLQGGIALMSFLHRFGIDRGGDLLSFSKVRFYAAALFNTKQLPETTNLKKLAEEEAKREEERQRYEAISGVIWVENNKLSISQLKSKSKLVTLEWDRRNDFAEYPC